MNSTIELHLRQRVIAQREVHNCWSTSTDTLLECSAIHESNAPTRIKNLQMRTIAHCEVHLRSRPSHFQILTGTVETTKRRYEMKDMRWKIWDELCAHGSKATIQNSRACGTETWYTCQHSVRPRSAFRNLCTGEGWYACLLALSYYHIEGRTWRYTHRKSDYCHCKSQRFARYCEYPTRSRSTWRERC